MSNITKNALAAALKKRLASHLLTDITVQSIADEAGVSRKTFYYHFKDIYDLMEWTMREEFSRVMAGNQTLDTWPQGIANLLEYIQDNRTLVLNLLFSLDDTFFQEQLNQVVEPMMTAVSQELSGYLDLPEEDRKFFTMMQVYGGVGIMLSWIKDGLVVPKEEVLERFVRYFSMAAEMLERYEKPEGNS